MIEHVSDNPLAKSFLQYIEEATKEETTKIIEKYKKQMESDLEAARAKIVAQAGVRLSEMMSIQDMGRIVRIEITKEEL